MAVAYQPQYRLNGTTTWTNWGAPITGTSVVVGNSTTPLTAATQYDFQVVASDSFGSTASNTVTSTTLAGVTITSLVLSGSKAFTTGTTDAVVGTIAVTMSSGAFSGTLQTGGADGASFKIVNVGGVFTLETNGALSTAKTYTVNIVATQSGIANSPFTDTGESIVGTAASSALIQIPSGVHTGAGLSGNNTPYASPLVHYNAFNGTGSGTGGGLGLTAQGRHTTVLATCLGGGTVDFGGASPNGWPTYTDASNWVAHGFPTDGSVSPMIHWAFSDSTTNTNFALYSNAQIRSNTTYSGSSGQTIEHWIRTVLSLWATNIPNMRTYYIRPMWEWNIGGPGANYNVGSAGNMPAFVEAFRGFANVCHDWGNSQTPRIAIKIIWSPSVFNAITSQSYGLPVIQQFPAPDANARPASDGVTQRYIDIMGPDFYWDTNADPRVGFDGLPTNGTFNRTTNQAWTMNALVDLALFFNIPIAVSETGFVNGFTTMYQNFFPNIVVPWLNSMNTSSYRSVGGLAGPMRWEFACWFDLTLGNAYCFSNPAGGDINIVGQAFGSISPTTFGTSAQALTIP